jgi:hypothetical protein
MIDQFADVLTHSGRRPFQFARQRLDSLLVVIAKLGVHVQGIHGRDRRKVTNLLDVGKLDQSVHRILADRGIIRAKKTITGCDRDTWRGIVGCDLQGRLTLRVEWSNRKASNSPESDSALRVA